jgi:hypothetical protein
MGERPQWGSLVHQLRVGEGVEAEGGEEVGSECLRENAGGWGSVGAQSLRRPEMTTKGWAEGVIKGVAWS